MYLNVCYINTLFLKSVQIQYTYRVINVAQPTVQLSTHPSPTDKTCTDHPCHKPEQEAQQETVRAGQFKSRPEGRRRLCIYRQVKQIYICSLNLKSMLLKYRMNISTSMLQRTTCIVVLHVYMQYMYTCIDVLHVLHVYMYYICTCTTCIQVLHVLHVYLYYMYTCCTCRTCIKVCCSIH